MKASLRMDSTASQEHNRRDADYITRELTAAPERTEDNIVLVDKPAREAYQEIFGPLIEDYNDRQKRTDRKIAYDGRGYYDKVLNGTFNKSTKQGNVECRQHPYYEMVIQVGNQEEAPPEDIAIDIYKSYIRDFQERNPHLVLIGAYIHLDETTPHMHVDYVPIAERQRGMRYQTGLNLAFEQQTGYKSKNAHDTAQMRWQEQEREVVRELCQERGLQVDEVQHNNSKHLTVDEYKEDQVQGDLALVAAIESVEMPDKSRKTLIQRLTRSEYTTIKVEDLEALKQQARAAEGVVQRVGELEEQVREQTGTIDRLLSGTENRQQAMRDDLAERAESVQEREDRLHRQEKLFQHIIHGEAEQEMINKYNGLVKQVKELHAERQELTAEVSGLKSDLNKLQELKATIQSKVAELKNWLSENIVSRYEKRFCRAHSAEFEEFKRQERDREDLGRF